MRANCLKENKPFQRDIDVHFPYTIESDVMLKTGLLIMASTLGIAAETKAIIELPFGKSYDLPLDFRFNDVPHAQWVRSYIYDSVRNAVVKAIYDEEFDKKSKMQIKLNFPEGNTHMLTALKVLYWTDKGFIVNYLLF